MRASFLSLFLTLMVSVNYAQTFKNKQTGVFVPQNKKVILFENSQNKKLILFKTNLQVNTDGVPTSYHPFDLRGNTIALNTILNGAAIYRLKDNIRISNPKKPNKFSDEDKKEMRSEAYSVFEKFRDSKFEKIPDGYKINWQNVLIAENNKPCVFKTGKYKGYFASATALKNDINTDKGECECKNQVDPFEVPTLVLAGGNNIVRQFGATVGDLVVAYNLTNKNIVYGVIGDTGPEENLGEGSVILNMKLIGTDKYPKTRKDTYALSTNNDILICIVPQSKAFNPEKPFTQQNLEQRILKWFSEQGYDNNQKIKEFFETNKSQYK
jgi:hypothetical protein